MYTSALETGLEDFYLYELNSKILLVASCPPNFSEKFDGMKTKFSNLFTY